jgi:hypothetical protein
MSEPYMTMAEIEAKYPNEWVLMDHFTTERKSGKLAGGRVLLHAPNREEFDRAFDSALEGVGDIAVHFTGKPDPNEIWMLNL